MDKKEAINSVTSDVYTLKYVSKQLQNDKDVMAAVTQDEFSLQRK